MGGTSEKMFSSSPVVRVEAQHRVEPPSDAEEGVVVHGFRDLNHNEANFRELPDAGQGPVDGGESAHNLLAPDMK